MFHFFLGRKPDATDLHRVLGSAGLLLPVGDRRRVPDFRRILGHLGRDDRHPGKPADPLGHSLRSQAAKVTRIQSSVVTGAIWVSKM